jgi:predicted transcriptional regulator
MVIMMKRRSDFEITAEMLDCAINGEKKTRLMYRANLSFDVLNNYLANLTSKGFLIFDSENSKYKTTPKGKKFLENCKNLSSELVLPTKRLPPKSRKKNDKRPNEIKNQK